MCCFVILLLSNEMQMSVRRFSAIPHLRVPLGLQDPYPIPDHVQLHSWGDGGYSL